MKTISSSSSCKETCCKTELDDLKAMCVAGESQNMNHEPAYCPEEDGLMERDVQTSCARLQNSAVLANLETCLSHLSASEFEAISRLIDKYPSLYADVPSQTTVLCHDIDVGYSQPIKQHPLPSKPKET